MLSISSVSNGLKTLDYGAEGSNPGSVGRLVETLYHRVGQDKAVREEGWTPPSNVELKIQRASKLHCACGHAVWGNFYLLFKFVPRVSFFTMQKVLKCRSVSINPF